MIDFFNYLYDNVINTWVVASISLIFGFIKLRKVLRKMSWDSDWLSYDIFMDGLAFSIGCIVLGIILICQKL